MRVRLPAHVAVNWSCEGWGLRERWRVFALKLEARRANLQLDPPCLGPNISGDPDKGGRAEEQAGSRPKERWAVVRPQG